MIEERKKILEAALDEFIEVGLQGSTLESIAERAELEPAVVRALFIDKESLLDELFREETEPMVGAVSLAVQEIEDPKELIRESMWLLDQWLLLHPRHVKLYLRCFLEESNIMESIFRRSLMPSEFFEKLNHLVEKGQVRCRSILMLSLLLDSLILFFHMMRSGMPLMSPDQSIEEMAEQRFEAVMDLFENGLYPT